MIQIPDCHVVFQTSQYVRSVAGAFFPGEPSIVVIADTTPSVEASLSDCARLSEHGEDCVLVYRNREGAVKVAHKGIARVLPDDTVVTLREIDASVEKVDPDLGNLGTAINNAGGNPHFANLVAALLGQE